LKIKGKNRFEAMKEISKILNEIEQLNLPSEWVNLI
jgi:hypothetical protein